MVRLGADQIRRLTKQQRARGRIALSGVCLRSHWAGRLGYLVALLRAACKLGTRPTGVKIAGLRRHGQIA